MWLRCLRLGMPKGEEEELLSSSFTSYYWKKNKKILIFHQGNEICCHPDGDAIFKFFFNSKNQVIQHVRIVHPNIWHHWLMFILIFHFLEKIAPAALADIFPNLSFSCENSSYWNFLRRRNFKHYTKHVSMKNKIQYNW